MGEEEGTGEMSYSLKQLLEWSLEDHLIQGYSFRPNSFVEIRHSGKVDLYETKEAEILLRRLIRRMNEGGDNAIEGLQPSHEM